MDSFTKNNNNNNSCVAIVEDNVWSPVSKRKTFQQPPVDDFGLPWFSSGEASSKFEVQNRFDAFSSEEEVQDSNVEDFEDSIESSDWLEDYHVDNSGYCYAYADDFDWNFWISFPSRACNEKENHDFSVTWCRSFKIGAENIPFHEVFYVTACCGEEFVPFAEDTLVSFEDYRVPTVQRALRACRRNHAREWRDAAKRVEEALIEREIQLNNIFYEGLNNCADADRSDILHYDCSCRIQKCVRHVVCKNCMSCVVHCRSVKCCGEVALIRQGDHTITPEFGAIHPARRLRSKGSLGRYFARTVKAQRLLKNLTFCGKAQGFIPTEFKFDVSLADKQMEHILRIPAVENLLSDLQRHNDEVSWPKVIRECSFFVFHLSQGGFTLKNILVSAAQLAANIGIPAVAKLDWTRFFPNAQANNDFSLVGGVITGLLSVVTVLATNALPSDRSVDQLMSRLSQIGRLISSFEKVQEYSHKIAQFAVEFVKTNLLGYSSEDLAEWKAIDDFCDEVVALNRPDFEQKCTVDLELPTVVASMLMRADQIQKQLDAMRVHPVSYGRFTKCHMFLIRARDICAQVGAGNMRPRTAPLVIHVHGGTGVGKSGMLSYLNSHLLVALGSTDPADLQNKVYWRYPTSDFFDGFRNGTEIVVCDDFGSAKDSENNPSPEPLEQIRMTNTAPFRPPMAHLTDKANTAFEAKAIIWTSNRPTFMFPSLTNPEAVHNRVHLRFKQFVAPGYGMIKNIDGKVCEVLDAEKVAREAENNPNAWRDCMRFQQQTVEGRPRADGTYEPIGERLGFEEFAAICVEALKKKQNIGKGVLEQEKSYYQTLIEGKAQAGDIDPQLVFYYQPSWLMQRCGRRTHVNVWASLCSMINQSQPRRITSPFKSRIPTYTELREMKIPDCVTVVPGKEGAFTLALADFCDQLLGGSPPCDLIDQLIDYCDGWCDEHQDHESEAFFWERFVAARAELSKRTVAAACVVEKGWKSLPGVIQFIIAMIGSVLGVELITSVIEYLFRSFKKLMSPTKKKHGGKSERYENSSKGPQKGTVERYETQTKGVQTGSVEQYETQQKSVQVGKVERYETQQKGVQTGTVERYETQQRSVQVGRVEQTLVGSPESVTDQNAAEIRRKVWQNTYLMSICRNGKDWVNLGTFTFVGGRVGVTNRHIMSAVGTEDMVLLTSADGRSYQVLASELNWFFVDENDRVHGCKDVAIVECPRQVHLHADIRDFFMTAEDFSRHTELEKISLLGHRIVGGSPKLILMETNVCKAWQHASFNLGTNQGQKSIRDFYTYALETQPGDCGGLVVAFDRRFARKIIGIHMAGISGSSLYSGACVATTREFIDKLVAGLPLRWDHSIINGEVAVDKPIEVQAQNGVLTHEGPIPGEFVHLGRSNQRVYSAKESAITPSVVAGVCGPINKKPAFLTRFRNEAGEIISPMDLALKKASTAACFIEPTALRNATNAVDQMINTVIQHDDNRPLTLEEAIAGVPGDEQFPAINRSTSPGYGWTKKGKGKTHWLGEDAYVFNNPELVAAYEAAHNRLKDGKRCGAYWTDTLKDELRPIAKVDAGKTRLFAAGEMVQTILLRQYFMGFTAHMARNKIDFESCVGVNVYGMDWNKIARVLQEVGPHVVAGDFTNYDGSLTADALWATFSVVDNFYRAHPQDTAEMQRIRALLWCEIVNSVHINGDVVFMWNHSQPSGCPFTSVLNSVLHSIIVRVVYILAARKYAPSLQSLGNFSMHVRHINYGDDDVTNISPEIIDWFNQETMAEMYATFGMTYTDELKSGVMVRSKTLPEVQFLKRAFVWDEEQARYRAPLELATIREMPCWNKTKGDKYALTRMVLEDAIYELAQHKRTVWDANYPVFEEARKIISARSPLQFPTWEELQFEDASKYFGFVKLGQNTVIGAQRQSSNASAQQNLPVSLEASQETTFGGWEGFPALLASVCPSKTISYLLDVKTSQTELTENGISTPGSDNNQLNNNNPIVFSGHAQNGEDVMPGSAAPAMGANPANTIGSADATNVFIPEAQEVTTFLHDGEVTEASMPTRLDTPHIDDNAADLLENSVKGFLKRPTHLKSFEWHSNTGVIGSLFSLDLPRDWLAVRMVQEKLQGFAYLKCDLVVEVQINAQPFNAGMLVMWFNPLAKQLSHVPSSTAHLGGITGYPCVFYRCGDATAFRMRVPFQSNISHFNLVTGEGTMGVVDCTVMSPLTGASNVDGTVWCWAENVSIEMPTGVPLKLPASVMSGIAQAGEPLKQDGTWRERTGKGPVEFALDVGEKVSNSIAKVPVIGPVAGVAGAIFGFGAKVAGWFGWSKPLDSEPPTGVTQVFGKNMVNSTGMGYAKVLALDSRNAADIPTEVFGTDEDEMAFATLLKRETYIDFFNFATTSPANTLLWKWPVHPRSMVKTGPFETFVQGQPSLLAYLSCSAELWRGSLIYSLKAVKTPFHSGRVRITFAPGADENTDFTKVDLQKCYSQVFDLRESSDMEFCIPYVSNTIWRVTSDKYVRGERDYSAKCYSYPTGMIYVTVVNTLRGPSTVADSIEILGFVTGGKDFQLARPGVDPTLRLVRAAKDVVGFSYSGTAQAGLLVNAPVDESTAPNRAATGEIFTGFRQWLKRYCKLEKAYPTSADYQPYIFETQKTLNIQRDREERIDARAFAGCLYRYVSGSQRVMVALATNKPKPYNVSLKTQTEIINPNINSQWAIDNPHGGIVTLTTTSERIMEYEIPFYSAYTAIPSSVGSPFLSTGYFGDSDNFKRTASNIGPSLYVSLDPEEYEIYAAAGESFCFGFQIGQPIVLFATQPEPSTYQAAEAQDQES